MPLMPVENLLAQPELHIELLDVRGRMAKCVITKTRPAPFPVTVTSAALSVGRMDLGGN